MIKTYLTALGACAFFLNSCTQNPAPNAAPPVTVTLQEHNLKKCLHDSTCAEIRLRYPVLSGGNAPVTAALNDSIAVAVRIAANAPARYPLQQALDSAMLELYAMLRDDEEARGEPMEFGYIYQLDSKIAAQTPRLFSLQMDGSSFSGGAHGYYFTALSTFDLQNGKLILLEDVVSDTTALRALLEKAFIAVHRANDPAVQLRDLLLEPDAPLAFPANFCIVPTGLRFVYNPYEVAAYAVGQTDFTLTWAELGTLCDSKKWVE